MKKIILYSFLVLLIVAQAFAVQNIIVDPFVLSVSDTADNMTYTGQFRIQNAGNEAITDLAAQYGNLRGTTDPSIYITNVDLSTVPSTLAVGQSINVTYEAVIEEDDYALQSYDGMVNFTFNGTMQQAIVQFSPVPVNTITLVNGLLTGPVIVGDFADISVDIYSDGTGMLSQLQYSLSNFKDASGNELPTFLDRVPTTVGFQDSDEIWIEVDTDLATPGTYTAQLNVSDNAYNHPEDTLTLSFTVQPRIETVSATLAQTGEYVKQVAANSPALVNITNTGNVDFGGLTYELTDFNGGAIPAALATITAPSGIDVGESATVQVSLADDNAQVPGTYTATLTIRKQGTIIRTIAVPYIIRAPQSTISISEINLPASGRNVSVAGSVIVNNTGDIALTNVQLSITNLATDATGSVTQGFNYLGAGFSQPIAVTVTVPASQDSGKKQIATLQLRSNELNQDIPIYANAASMLAIDRVKLYFDGSSTTISKSGDTVDNKAEPGDSFETKIIVENLFSDSSNIDMEVFDISGLFEGIGEDEDDIADDFDDTFDVDADDKSDEEDIAWDEDEIDFRVSDGKHKMTLIVYARDDNGAVHSATFEIDVDIDRDSGEEFIFDQAIASPSKVTCSRSFRVIAEGFSAGKDDNKNAALRIRSTALDIDVLEQFELGAYDDDDCNMIDDPEDSCSELDYDRTFTVASTLPSGTYPISIDVLYDSTKVLESRTVTLTVGACSGVDFTDNGDVIDLGGNDYIYTGGSADGGVDVQYTSGGAMPSAGVVATARVSDTTPESGFRDSRIYIWLLTAFCLAAIAVLIGLLVWARS